jgi:3-keto-disaccharide hydrolase/AAA domain-containing protein
MSDVVNPYIAGSPITGSEMFFGREDVFEFISQTLIGQHRDNVIVLYGQRRTGKTSVLYQMHSHLGERYLCIFMDLHGFALEGLEGFLWELANHMARVLRRDYQIDLLRPNRAEFMADPRSFFENEFLNQVWSACGDRHVLLMLDEAIRLQEQVQAGKLGNEIFEYMRHLMQHFPRLNFLFSLGSGLEEMEKEYAFLFNVGLYKKISFLDRNAATALITQPVKDCYQVEPAAVERILQITSGHPYYTQLICHSLFNRWQHGHGASIEASDVDEILDEVVERGLAVLKHVWEESNPGEKAVMAGMVATMGNSNCSVGVDDINQAWTRFNVDIPKGEMAKATRSLMARDIITGQDEYVFTVDLHRLWVQKYRRLDWVKEEIADTIREWSSSATATPQTIPLPTTTSKGRTLGIRSILLIGLMLVLIVGGFGTYYVARNNSIAAATTRATATAQAQARATATVSSTYPFSTNLAFIDPLNSNSSNNWDEYFPNSNGSSCQFKQGAYHASETSQQYFTTCFNTGPEFDNFTYEVKMKIIKGDYGGMIFRGDSTTNDFYYLKVGQDGSYRLFLYQNGSGKSAQTLKDGPSIPGFHTGLKQSNLIAVVARGDKFDLYANGQLFASTIDGMNTYSRGEIGLTAEDNAHPTEVEYSDVKIWKF